MTELTRTRGGGNRHPVFDSERFVQMKHSNVSRAKALQSILANVIAKGTTPITQARMAWERKQPAQAAHVIHNLKGCVANLGGMRVYELAKLAEIRLEISADPSEVLQLLNDLEHELTLFIQTARDWLLETGEDREQRVVIEPEQRVLLTSYLLDSNILACDLFESLENELRALMNPRDFQGLHRAMENLNFTQALVHLASLSKNSEGV